MCSVSQSQQMKISTDHEESFKNPSDFTVKGQRKPPNSSYVGLAFLEVTFQQGSTNQAHQNPVGERKTFKSMFRQKSKLTLT